MNPFEQFQNQGDEIVDLTKKIHQILDTAIDEKYFGVDELECVQGQMTDLLRQGVFWLQKENPQRFIYDLKNFLTWLITFVETRQNERG
jgi:predicted RecA/RadA family phage recombinase